MPEGSLTADITAIRERARQKMEEGLRHYHAERDLARLGRLVAGSGDAR